MVDVVQIKTERLLLRPWQASDRAPFADLNADPEVRKYFPAILDRKESDKSIDRFQTLVEERGWGFWAVETGAGDFIGMTGLHSLSPDLPFYPGVEIGWRLAKSYWGKGYATEAARAALEFGFTKLQLPEIVSFTAVGNIRSRAVMERLGMVPDSSTFQHPAIEAGHSLRDHCLYRIAQKQWQDLKNS